MIDMPFADRLTHHLETKQWNYADLRRAMGNAVSISTVSRWASGEREPRLSEALLVAQALEVSLDELAENPKRQKPVIDPEDAKVLDMVRILGYEIAKKRLMNLKPEDVRPGQWD